MIECKRVLIDSSNVEFGVEALVDEKCIVMMEKTQGGHWDTTLNNNDRVWLDIDENTIKKLRRSLCQ